MIALADCAVTVSDAQQAARWWSEKLGFRVHTVGEAGGHAVLVAPPGDRFVLHLCQGFAPVEPGNTGVAFVTDEIDSLVARMRAGGVEFPEALTKQSWGSMAKFADPDGNIYWLLEAPASFIRAETRAVPARSTGARRRPKAKRTPARRARAGK